ncbi:MAG: class I SAM-dependent methyltransferase [Defluviitaleaceae bacterium]|nr:class I SAM-dependent methyltransferase [Defluviitaleaceae bacterium]
MNPIQTPNWKDYILIDAGGGEKLEMWGKVKVIRPDPQAFWPRSLEADWHDADMHYHRSKAGGGSWQILGKNIPEAWQIAYKDLHFHIRPTGFKHMGLFPEQAVNWDWLQDKIRSRLAYNEDARILNLFAYTGGATVACIKAGANVTHIDAAKGMNRWAGDNISLSGLKAAPHRVLTDDVLKFVQREARRGNTYHGIIMDPPVFGRGPGGEMWKLEERLYDLVNACQNILATDASFILINAYTAGFSPTVFGNILSLSMQKAGRKGAISVGEIGLAAKSGITLPCGMFARWED